MPGTIVITGGDPGCVAFTLMHPAHPEICWNISRIERDAYLGKFGPPEEAEFAQLQQYANPEDKWKYIDREKVRRFINLGSTIVSRPNWNTKGKGPELALRLIDLPSIAVILKGKENWHSFPIDGNHRMLAREMLGLKTFPRFILPPELEGNYRIRFTEI